MQLGACRSPCIGDRVIKVGLGTVNIASQDLAIWQNDGRAVSKLSLRKTGDRSPRIRHGVVDFAGIIVCRQCGVQRIGISTAKDQNLTTRQDVLTV